MSRHIHLKVGLDIDWLPDNFRSIRLDIGPLFHVYWRKNHGDRYCCFRVKVLMFKGRALLDVDTPILSRIRIGRLSFHYLFWKRFTMMSSGDSGPMVFTGDR